LFNFADSVALPGTILALLLCIIACYFFLFGCGKNRNNQILDDDCPTPLENSN
jgi:hypothetical protein